jgi:hypothetical protein
MRSRGAVCFPLIVFHTEACLSSPARMAVARGCAACATAPISQCEGLGITLLDIGDDLLESLRFVAVPIIEKLGRKLTECRKLLIGEL